MLLKEYRRKYDTYADKEGDRLYRPVILKLLIKNDGKMSADGIVYMDAREYICRSIAFVDKGRERGKDIVPRKTGGP